MRQRKDPLVGDQMGVFRRNQGGWGVEKSPGPGPGLQDEVDADSVRRELRPALVATADLQVERVRELAQPALELRH